MTDYVFVKFDFIYIMSIGQALGQVNAGVNLNTVAVDVDIVASLYATRLHALFKITFNKHPI